MVLQKYKDKRSFTKTPEPSGKQKLLSLLVSRVEKAIGVLSFKSTSQEIYIMIFG